MKIQLLNGERWLKAVSGGMAVFCGAVATLITVMVVAGLIVTAIVNWTGKPLAWRIDGETFALASTSRTVMSICPPGKAMLCKPAYPPSAKGYASGMLGQLALAAPMAALAYGLFQASACFVGIARGRLLARRTTDRLVKFAVAGLSFVVLAPNAGRLGTFVADGSRKLMNWVTGDPSFQVSAYSAKYVGMHGMLTMVYAVTLTIIAVILVKASTIADDHAQIV